ncbi:MAG: site-2 protease family protein [Firmicutes bacterium]|nr:site-2 protease family protein [Bacillota bacterium]
MWILSILILIVLLSIIIIVHEFGHFMWAKKFGVHIYEFSIGMGPVVFKHKGKDNIDYNLRALPIGGFVAMAGEVYEDDNKIKKEKLMCNKPWYQRLIILVAGVTNNFILAIVVLFLGALIWGSAVSTPKIVEVVKDSAMDKAGVTEGDTIVSINDKKVSSWDKAQLLLIYKSKDNKYKIEIKHENGKKETLYVKPEIIKNEKGEENRVFGFKVESKQNKGFLNAVKYAFTKFIIVIETMAMTIGGLITGKLSIKALSGPVGMYEVVNQGIGYGLNYMLYLLAFLSINVGFLNILPFPAFDGGRVLFLIIEKIKGSKVNQELENKFHTVGFILLMILMIYITIQDIIRFF